MESKTNTVNSTTTITATTTEGPRTKRRRVLKNPQYRCSYCGEFGHNTRTCPKKKADAATVTAS